MIELPADLRDALDDALAPYPPRALADAADNLSATYRRAVTSAGRQLAPPTTRDPARSSQTPSRRADAADMGDATDDERAATSAVAPSPTGAAAMTALQVAAYAATRLPATFAAIAAALTQARLRRPDWRPQSLLDVGAGTGAALWATRAVWPDLAHATLLERDPQMVALGKRLAERLPDATAVEWRQGDARNAALWGADDGATNASNHVGDANPHGARRNKAAGWSVTPQGYGLVTAAYVLSELGAADRAALVARLWDATGGALSLVAPGTPIGFAHIRAAREQLIAAGATILAPCPHDGVCPMGAAGPLAATDDWCHFAARLARSRLHRQIKGGDLAYEDEKYSYVIAVRPSNPAVAPDAPIGGRIVRHPQTRTGLVALEVCAPGGLERRIVTRKDRDAYRQARDLRWGDAVAEP